jgi:3-phosphoshikimate 1-carboxyvinyltransferase
MSGDFSVQRAIARGEVRVPGSKSVTHRAFLLAAQSATPCTVVAPLRSADTDATLACLHRLGYAPRPDRGAVRFEPASPRPPTQILDCRNAGTALRLLAGLAARLPFAVTLDGDASLRQRPNGPLLDALRFLGASVRDGRGVAPFTLRGPVRAGAVRFAAGVSSQFASSLLLSLPMVHGTSRVHLAAPVASRPYLDITCAVAAGFRVKLQPQDAHTDGSVVFAIEGDQAPRAEAYTVEGDWSAAAFPIVAAAITGGDVTVRGLRPDSRQGDRAILDFARRFGCRVDETEDGVRVRGGGLVSPGEVGVAATPDLFPALAVLAACSAGTTTFTGGASLRVKESDRIAAVAAGLGAMGVRVQERPDGLVVHGVGPTGALRGARLHSHGDHRIHMAFAVAGLAADGVTVVDDADCAAVSYPGFHTDLAGLSREVVA